MLKARVNIVLTVSKKKKNKKKIYKGQPPLDNVYYNKSLLRFEAINFLWKH